jgi:hypothetical protein
MTVDDKPRALTRRGVIAGAAALSSLAAAGTLSPLAAKSRDARKVPDRLAQAYEMRVKAARLSLGQGSSRHLANGDEERLGGVACYSKGLPHDVRGLCDPKAYAVLRSALASGRTQDFETIPLGGFVKLANPQAALAFDLLGPDGSQPELAAPPAFSSPEQGAEMVELYWQALLRDVPFAAYDSHAGVEQAADDLSRLAAFRGPRQGGRVVAGTLFRGVAAGALTGPYVSQFLWKELPFTPLRVEQRIRTAVPGVDFLTAFSDWLAVQNGALTGVNRFDDKPRYIRSGRDLGEYVHRDFTDQAFLGACLAALKMGTLPDGGNPYKHSRTQSAFTTFGQPYLIYLLAVVTQAALTASWYQKWMVHRRLRPEELGGRIEVHLSAGAEMPLHESLLASAALEETRRRHGSALLPQAFPEGCPMHPSYPAAHAVIGGACATALKACLDESYVIPNPVEASADGLSLTPYQGGELTVGGELDKLAGNVAFGRNFAGIHWRSDGIEGMRLGEEVAIAVLEELSLTGNEIFSGFSLRRFDGHRIRVGREGS